jgi:hypothetical protein
MKYINSYFDFYYITNEFLGEVIVEAFVVVVVVVVRQLFIILPFKFDYIYRYN